jgi:hypothetical protein
VQVQSSKVLISDAPSKSEARFRSTQGKTSTSSPATATEVTPGLQQEQSPMPINFMSRWFIDGMIKWKPTQNNIISTPKLGQACIGE